MKKLLEESPPSFIRGDIGQINDLYRAIEKLMKITGEYVSKGKLFTEMENMKDANVNGERYMRSKDVKKMAQEVTSSVVAEVVTDYLYEENEGIKRS